MKQDAFLADDLDAVIVGIVIRVDAHLGGMLDIQLAIAVRGLVFEHDHGRGVDLDDPDRFLNRGLLDPGEDLLDRSAQVVAQREQVVAVVENQWTSTALLFVETPQPGRERHLPGSIAACRC